MADNNETEITDQAEAARERLEEARQRASGDDADDADGVGDSEADPTPEVDSAETEEPKPADPSDRTKNKLLGNLVFVLGFVVTLVAGYYAGQEIRVRCGDAPDPAGDGRYKVELRGDEPQKGPDDALVTIIEFADFQCPYCADSVEPLNKAMKKYNGDVRLIFKHYPLGGHTRAKPAAHAAWAAHEQGEFWEFHDRLFEAKASIEKVPAWVKELGLDAAKFGADMESDGARNAIDSDFLAGSRVGVTGTPAFYVNGNLYRGKMDDVAWKKVIRQELQYAKEVADDNNLKPGQVYDHLMKDAMTRQQGAPDRAAPSNRPARPGAPNGVDVYAVPIEGAPVKGADNALVTVVEFADYHCGYCARVKPTLEQLLAEHPDEVRLVYRQRPLAMHPQARDASRAALAAHEQGQFWPMHDELFRTQAKTLDQFKGIAEKLGLDVDEFVADYESQAIADQVTAEIALAQQFGISGTPAFFINGRYLSGAVSYTTLEDVFNQRLVEAKTRVAGGATDVYAAILEEGESSVKKAP